MSFNILDVVCEKEDVLKMAFTHPSYTKEHSLPVSDSYERLEFLGDAVLKLITSYLLYEKYPKYQEGELSKMRSILVSDAVLAQIAKDIGIDKRLILGSGEEHTGGRNRESNLACSMEAVLGAYFLSDKMSDVENFLKERLLPKSDDIDHHFVKYNAKAVLQEYTQKENCTTPEYITQDIKGPNHNPTFYVDVFFNGELLASGTGKTKKEAQQNSAYNACIKLGIIEE